AAAGSKSFSTSAEIDLGKGEHASLEVYADMSVSPPRAEAVSRYRRDDNHAFDRLPAPSIEQALLNLADRWPGAVLRLGPVTVKGSRTVRGRKLQELAMAAWAEAFGVGADSAGLQKRKEEQQAEVKALREAMLAELRGGPKGVKKWNARSVRERDQIGP